MLPLSHKGVCSGLGILSPPMPIVVLPALPPRLNSHSGHIYCSDDLLFLVKESLPTPRRRCGRPLANPSAMAQIFPRGLFPLVGVWRGSCSARCLLRLLLLLNRWGSYDAAPTPSFGLLDIGQNGAPIPPFSS